MRVLVRWVTLLSVTHSETSLKAKALTNTGTNHGFRWAAARISSDRFIARLFNVAFRIVTNCVVKRTSILLSECLQLLEAGRSRNERAVVHLAIISVEVDGVKSIDRIYRLNYYFFALRESILIWCIDSSLLDMLVKF